MEEQIKYVLFFVGKNSKILDKVAKQRQVLLSTMDEEFYQNAKKEITTKKKVYELGKWNPRKGPSISEV